MLCFALARFTTARLLRARTYCWLVQCPYREVFAPNNAAFTTFLELNGLTVEKLLASPDLSTILANHAVAG